MKKLAALLLILIGVGGVAGCNTIHGLGQDIERGGEKLQGTSRDTQEKM